MSVVRTFAGAEGVSRAAAEEFTELAVEAVARSGRFTVALSGGSTPQRLYERLAEPPHRARVPWDRVEVFWGDERAVAPDHPDSNARLAVAALLSRVPIPPEGIHRIHAERADRDAAAREYQDEIARVFGVAADGPAPALDLVLLGLGADGHTASLFPGSAALAESRRWVVSHFVPALGAERITLTPPILNRAREVRVLVTGADKAGALRAVLHGPRAPERFPAQLIQPESGRLVWLVDRGASIG